MTGVEWLMQHFPRRDQNVFFHPCGLTHASPSHKKLWDASVDHLHRAVEHAIQAGGRNFICRNNNLADYIFMDIVTQHRSTYPEITLNICYEKENHRIGRCSSNYEEIYGSVDRTIILFPDRFVTRRMDYLECLVAISGQVIGLVRSDLVERGRLVRLCQKHRTSFINTFAAADSSRAVAEYIPPSNTPDIQSLAARMMQDIFASSEIDEIYQAWQRKRGLVIKQLQQNRESGNQLAELLTMDAEYLKSLKDMCVGCGTKVIVQFINQRQREGADISK